MIDSVEVNIAAKAFANTLGSVITTSGSGDLLLSSLAFTEIGYFDSGFLKIDGIKFEIN